MNPGGVIAGSYAESAEGRPVTHGFLRFRNGTFTTFDGPGASATNPGSINAAWEITGTYLDSSSVTHGFLRSGQGLFVPLDVPGSIVTGPTSINDAGEITGSYLDESFVQHGFLRSHARGRLSQRHLNPMSVVASLI
jgi:hypothetical protein